MHLVHFLTLKKKKLTFSNNLYITWITPLLYQMIFMFSRLAVLCKLLFQFKILN